MTEKVVREAAEIIIQKCNDRIIFLENENRRLKYLLQNADQAIREYAQMTIELKTLINKMKGE